MRRSRPDNLLHPAVLLALSVTLCGAPLYAVNQPGALLQHRLADRATELTAGQRETVAQLLQCLTEAAKELQKHDGKAAAAEAPAATRVVPAGRTAELPPNLAPPAVRLIDLHHLDLPPPTASR